MGQKSGRNYSQRTLKILWGRSAGRCSVLSCRIELLVDATDYDPIVVIGEIAHIEASSDKGPRANKIKTARERDQYDNLILLCQNCHARLDGQKNSNSVDYIKQLRNDHESWVRSNLPERGRSVTGWKTVFLQGIYPFDSESTINALSPDFFSENPLIIKIDPDRESWGNIQLELVKKIDALLSIGDSFDYRIAIFPLAPVSACLALGYHLTNRPHIRLFQYYRDDHSWVWPDNSFPPDSIITTNGFTDSKENVVGDIAIAFDLSASVTDKAIQEVNVQFIGIIHVSVSSPNTGWLQHSDQLKILAKSARQVFEKCIEKFPHANKWHIFYAGPAPGAVIVGQQINPTMCPPVQLYEYRHKLMPSYQPSILLD